MDTKCDVTDMLPIDDTTIEGPHSIKVRVYEPTESGDAGSHDVGLL